MRIFWSTYWIHNRLFIPYFVLNHKSVYLFCSELKIFRKIGVQNCYGTVTSLLMDSSKSYINREPSTLGGWDEWSAGRRDWRFDWLVSLAYATTFLCILWLQSILKFIPCSELSFRGPKLGPHQKWFSVLMEIIKYCSMACFFGGWGE